MTNISQQAQPSRQELMAEVAALRQEMTKLRQDKEDLEMMLEMTAEHSDTVTDELQQEKEDLEMMLEVTTEHSDTVTEELQNKAEEALRESERRLRLIVEATPVPVIISRVSDGEIVYANHMSGPLVGLSTETLLGRKVTDFYHDPADQQPLLDALQQQGEVNNYELRIKRADSSLLWAEVFLRSLTFNDEPSLLSAIHDITERKRAEQERLQLSAIQQELAIAQEIQQSLLLPNKPDWTGIDVICHSTPAREVGGDFYTYHAFELDGNSEGIYAIAVGDVSGKGMSAALLMAVSLASFQSIIGQALAPGELLAHLDSAIVPYTRTGHRNCALVYAEITPPTNHPIEEDKDGVLRVANAGCITPIIRRVNGTVEWVEVGGIPLGMGLGARYGYQEVSLSLSKGDLVILTSDGVVEAMTAAEEMFGFDRLEQAVASGSQTSAEAMLAHLRAAVEAFAGGTEPYDDLTIVVVQV